jgi:four helix bundle protein
LIFDFGWRRRLAIDETEFRRRTKQFALQVIRLVQSMPHNEVSHVLARQLLRSGTSVGANYRAACRAKSTADMIAKLSIVEEEADETGYWLELILESGVMPQSKLADLRQEANEITAMTVSSIKTLRSRPNIPKSKIQNPK